MPDYVDAAALAAEEFGHDPKSFWFAKIEALLLSYDSVYRHIPWTVVEPEQVFRVPVYNPETGRPSRRWEQTGRVDGMIRDQDGKLYMLEHKTTSWSIDDPSSLYWRRISSIDSQASMYMLAQFLLGKQLHGCLYDVLRKPYLKPLKGQNPKDYRDRLIEDMVDKRPDFYFQQRVIHRLGHELIEWSEELWGIQQEIGDAIRTGRHHRNTSSCFKYNSACDYLGVCCGEQDIERWPVQEHHDPQGSPPDEYEVPLGGTKSQLKKGTLSHSRIDTFQTCRRKHYFHYVLRRRPPSLADAPTVGAVVHAGLEKWWSNKTSAERGA